MQSLSAAILIIEAFIEFARDNAKLNEALRYQQEDFNVAVAFLRGENVDLASPAHLQTLQTLFSACGDLQDCVDEFKLRGRGTFVTTVLDPILVDKIKSRLQRLQDCLAVCRASKGNEIYCVDSVISDASGQQFWANNFGANVNSVNYLEVFWPALRRMPLQDESTLADSEMDGSYCRLIGDMFGVGNLDGRIVESIGPHSINSVCAFFHVTFQLCVQDMLKVARLPYFHGFLTHVSDQSRLGTTLGNFLVYVFDDSFYITRLDPPSGGSSLQPTHIKRGLYKSIETGKWHTVKGGPYYDSIIDLVAESSAKYANPIRRRGYADVIKKRIYVDEGGYGGDDSGSSSKHTVGQQPVSKYAQPSKSVSRPVQLVAVTESSSSSSSVIGMPMQESHLIGSMPEILHQGSLKRITGTLFGMNRTVDVYAKCVRVNDKFALDLMEVVGGGSKRRVWLVKQMVYVETVGGFDVGDDRFLCGNELDRETWVDRLRPIMR